MKNLLSAVAILGVSCNCFAETSSQKPVWEQLFVASFPIILFIVVFVIFIKVLGKKTSNINQGILDSNLEIAKQIKRIADHIEKGS